jgi:hypothetical protein
LLALLRRVCFRLGLRLALRLLSSLVFAEDELAVKDEVLELLRCLRRLAPFLFSPASAATCIAGAAPAASGCDGAGATALAGHTRAFAAPLLHAALPAGACLACAGTAGVASSSDSYEYSEEATAAAPAAAAAAAATFSFSFAAAAAVAAAVAAKAAAALAAAAAAAAAATFFFSFAAAAAVAADAAAAALAATACDAAFAAAALFVTAATAASAAAAFAATAATASATAAAVSCAGVAGTAGGVPGQAIGDPTGGQVHGSGAACQGGIGALCCAVCHKSHCSCAIACAGSDMSSAHTFHDSSAASPPPRKLPAPSRCWQRASRKWLVDRLQRVLSQNDYGPQGLENDVSGRFLLGLPSSKTASTGPTGFD